MELFSFKKSSIPSKDKEFSVLCKRVSGNYQSANYEVDTFTKTKLADLANQYESLLNEMYGQRTDRNPAIKQIIDARKTNISNLDYVKSYINDKYGKANATRYYEEFGIIKTSNGYSLPFAQDMHSENLIKLASALRKHGFIENNYGANYWEPLATSFKNLLSTNDAATGNISDFSSRKNELKTQLKEGLTSIRFLVRALYPKTYQAEWRKLGFLKERF